MNDDQGAHRRSYGAAPLLVGGGLAVLLAAGAVTGIAAGYFNGSYTATIASVSEPSTPEPSPTGDDDGTNPSNPSVNPDRGSDHPGDSDPGSTGGPDIEEELPAEDTVYTIVKGDTLTSLSSKFGMSVDALARYNAIFDPNVISEGATLRVPGEYPPESWG